MNRLFWGMKIALLVLLACACAFSQNPEITARLDKLPDGSTEIRMLNESKVALTAFAISVNYVNKISTVPTPLTVYVDPEIDVFRPRNAFVRQLATGPVPAQGEFTMSPEVMVGVSPSTGRPAFSGLLTAGIFADGSTDGDAGLLTRLMLRRTNMLAAVETTLEMLSYAGRRNTPRSQFIDQFKKITDSLNRWYLPSEQQVGLWVYQSYIQKLMSLPESEVGSPFPPDAFVAEETGVLAKQRARLLGSEPSLADASRIGR
jgi:hypothetical protein